MLSMLVVTVILLLIPCDLSVRSLSNIGKLFTLFSIKKLPRLTQHLPSQYHVKLPANTYHPEQKQKDISETIFCWSTISRLGSFLTTLLISPIIFQHYSCTQWCCMLCCCVPS